MFVYRRVSFLSPSPAKPLSLVTSGFALAGSGSLPEKVDAESRQMNLRHTFCNDGTQVDNKKAMDIF